MRAGQRNNCEQEREEDFHGAIICETPRVTKNRAMLVLLLVSGLIISLSMGMRQSFGLFMAPITTDLGVSAAAFAFSIALQNIVWGISQPFVGAWADRYGARPVVFVTALLYAAGLTLMIFS